MLPPERLSAVKTLGGAASVCKTRHHDGTGTPARVYAARKNDARSLPPRERSSFFGERSRASRRRLQHVAGGVGLMDPKRAIKERRAAVAGLRRGGPPAAACSKVKARLSTIIRENVEITTRPYYL